MVDTLDIDDEIAKILAMVFPDCRIKHYLSTITVFYEPNKYCTEVVITVFWLGFEWYVRIYDNDYMPVNNIIIRLGSIFEMSCVTISEAIATTATKACTYCIKGTTDGHSYFYKHD